MNRRTALHLLSAAAGFSFATRAGGAWAGSRQIKPDASCVLLVVDV